MSIRFVCRCGKHLRAREDMAARRVPCPACGTLVGVPAPAPAHRGAAGPLTPEEIARRNAGPAPAASIGPVTILFRHRFDPNVAPLAIPITLDAGLTLPAAPPVVPSAPPPPTPRPRRARGFESRWYHCLQYPLSYKRRLAAFGIVQVMLLGALTTVAPMLSSPEAEGAEPLALALAAAGGGLAAACVASGFLDGVRQSGAAGETRYVPLAGGAFGLRAAVRWTVCFLAGPVFPAASGVWYWLGAGEPSPLDRLVLAGTASVAVGYWLLAVSATGETGWLRDANPEQVARLFRRLGPRAALAFVAAPALGFAYARVMTAGVEELHESVAGLLLLAMAGTVAAYLATFLFRLLGVWCYRTRPRGAA
jgi:hypothetical protein